MAMEGLNGDNAGELHSTNKKIELQFNIHGQLIGNKNEFKIRCLALAKVQIGLTYDEWRNVPNAKLADIWETLQNEYIMPDIYKKTLLDHMGIQWKTWKKNIRKRYLGEDKEHILMLKDKVPDKEKIPVAAWNIFIDREATDEKLSQRKKAKYNRSKKTDVHCLGRTSYAELEVKLGKDANGQEPDRTEVYVEARRQKTGSKSFHPKVAATMEKLREIQSNQIGSSGSSSSLCLDNDALTQVFGKDKRGRTRGVGMVSWTKLQASLPARTELQKVKAQVEKYYGTTNEKMDNLQSSIDHLINLSEGKELGQSKENVPPGSRPLHNKQIEQRVSNATIIQIPRSSVPSSEVNGYYNIRDLQGVKTIGVCTIDSITNPGTIVHHRPLQSFEVKVNVIRAIPGMEEEPLWRGIQGGADTIGEVVGGFVAWPRHLLEKAIG